MRTVPRNNLTTSHGFLRASHPINRIFIASCMLILVAAMSMFLTGCGKEEGRFVGSVYYPVNEQGQTYGSSALAYEQIPEGILASEAIEYLPDLVSVVNSDGTEGYVLREDFHPSTPTSPEEAILMQNDGAFDEEEVPLYASDGKTVLGTFTTGSDNLEQGGLYVNQ